MKKYLPIIGGVLLVIVAIVVLNANKTCDVTFDSRGGTPISAKRIKCGSLVEKPNVPYYEGYEFNYWYDSKTNKEFDFNTPINESIILLAKYTKN